MRKISKLLLMGVVALGVGFTACNNDDIDMPDQEKGNTHVSIALKMGKGSSFRSLPNDYNYIGEWGGNDEITSITVFISNAAAVTYKKYSVGDGEAYEMENGVVTPKTVNAAIQTTPGWKEVYVLVNANTAIETYLGATGLSGTIASSGAFKAAYANVLELANSSSSTFTVSTSASKLAQVVSGKDAIVMTNFESQTITVAPNVTAEQTISSTKPNRVSLEVERAVARVMVTTAATTYNVPSADGSSTIGALSDITWVIAQGENSLFVQRKATWETPNYSWVPGQGGAVFETQAGDKYDYSGLYENYVSTTQFGGTTIPTIANYSTAPIIGEESILKGKFILPNTHLVAPGEASGFKKGNTAYVMVRAKFVPSKFAGTTTTVVGDVAGTFYLGANGKFYHNFTDALSAEYGVPGQTVAQYVGGKVIYYAWVNPDEVPAWYNSPVLRNNIYHIHITGFKTIGTNWNPLFPENPNSPKDPEDGGNPDPKPNTPDVNEPENPIDPEEPLTTPETWMSVDVTVLPWLVHSYQVDLGI